MAEFDDDHVETEIKEIFDFFDKDRNGTIDAIELTKCLKCLGETVSDDEVIDMIAAMDCDGDGTIDYPEFLNEMKKRYGASDIEKELKAFFNQFKQEDNPNITAEGIQDAMITIFKESISLDEAEDMIKLAGGTKGFVNYEDFRAIMINGLAKS